MRIYCAGLVQGGFVFRAKKSSKQIALLEDLRRAYPYDLESYHYIKENDEAIEYYRHLKKTIFLDSGAFSMFTQGIKIDLKVYADYIKAHADVIHVASNLDEIGQHREQDSYNNQRALERYGVKVQPVHHARDDDKWLLKYMAEGYDYIFLGGMVAESTKYLRGWLDHVWHKYLTNKDGSAKIKVHGFGLTTVELMRRYPWYSVDSTSWVITGRFGSIYLDMPGRDFKLFISDQSPTKKDWDRHYDTLSPLLRGRVDEYIRSLGYDPALLRTDYGWRDHWNIAFFMRMMQRPEPVFLSTHQPVVSLF